MSEEQAPPPPDYHDSEESASARVAARLAAEARMADRPANRTAADAHQDRAPDSFSAADKLPFYRIINSELVPKVSKAQAVKTLDVLLTLVSNILDPPDARKSAMYRQLRLTNSQIVRNVVDVPGALDVLYEAKFKKETVEFVPYLTFAPSPSPQALHRLRVARFVLRDVLARAKADEEREQRYKQSERDAESVRSQKALLQFEEDRRLKRERDERERIAREAKAAKGPEPVRPVSTGPSLFSSRSPTSRPSRSSRTSATDPRDPPPSYGTVHGRVLGTGEPPEPVLTGISQQDLEPSDGEPHSGQDSDESHDDDDDDDDDDDR